MTAKIIPFRPRKPIYEPESPHFSVCPVCHQRFDMRSVEQVMQHHHDAPPINIIGPKHKE